MRDKSRRFSAACRTISVIGYPGSGLARCHVGKSCLIHRFLSHTPYCEDHLSVLNFSEFDSEVIAGSHWLFWGYSDVFLANDIAARLRIIEHCDFIDDHIFASIPSNRIYFERCTSRMLTLNTRKLAYICKEQLGHEDSFPRTYLEPGYYDISAFMCVYDVTLSDPPASHQAVFLKNVLHVLSSVNMPLVLVTSKHDSERSERAISLLESSLQDINTRWLKRNFCIVETSSRRNFNVDRAFYYVSAAASGCLYEVKRRKSYYSNANHFRTIALRLKHFCSNKRQPCGHQSRKSSDPPMSSLFADAADSFRLACSTHGLELDLDHQNVKSPLNYHFTRAKNDRGSRTRNRAVTSDEPCEHGSPLRHNSRSLSEDTFAVSSPSMVSRLSKLCHPSHSAPAVGFFNDQHMAITNNDPIEAVPNCIKSATVQVNGATSTVCTVVRALRSAFPQGQFRSKDGAWYRVSITPSLPSHGHSVRPLIDRKCRHSTSQFSSLVRRRPFSCPSHRQQLFPANKFSCPPLVGFDRLSDKALSPSENRKFSDNRITDVSGGQKPELHLRVFVYTSLSNLMPYKNVGCKFYDCSSQHCHIRDLLLCWNENSNFAKLPELIIEGLKVSHRSSLPFFTANNLSARVLLRHLLTLVSRQSDSLRITDKAQSANSTQLFPVSWISLGPIDHPSVVSGLLHHIQASTNQTCSYPPLLTTLIFFPLSELGPLNDISHDSVPLHRLPFIPFRVCDPKTDSNITAVHYIGLPQWTTISQALESYALSGELLNVLFVHSLISSWSAVAPQIRAFLDLLFVGLSSPFSRTNDCSHSFSLSCVVVIVLSNSSTPADNLVTPSDFYPAVSCLRKLANMHHIPFIPLHTVTGLDTGENCAPVPHTVSSCPTSMRHPINVTRGPRLLVFSVLSGSPNEAVHQGLLQGHPAVWSRVLRMHEKPEVDENNPVSARVEISPRNTSSLTHLPADSFTQPPAVTTWKSLIPSASFPATPNTSNSTMVALPWLPLSLSNAGCLSMSRCIGSSQAQSTAANADFISSVDEYYDELPNVPRRKISTTEQLQRRIDRPKRPQPETNSTTFCSAISPPERILSNLLLSSSSSSATANPPIRNSPTSVVVCPEPTSRAPPHWPSESDSGVYAEVDDTFISEVSSPITRLSPSFCSV